MAGRSFKRRRREQPRYSLFSSASAPHGGVGAGSDHDLLRERNGSSLELPDGDNSNSNSEPSEAGETADGTITGRRFYDDLTAIDWIFEYTRERTRLRNLRDKTGLLGYAANAFDSSQIWLVLIGTGVAAGLVAAAIDVVANWLGGLKEGYCTTSFYLSKEFCCWGLDAAETCTDWAWWSRALRVGSSKGARYVVEYNLYMLFSVSCIYIYIRGTGAEAVWADGGLLKWQSQILFATSASLLVKNFAPYARHSGIPEIKTVLGGFVIRRFLGAWTLVIKSIGLVCLKIPSSLRLESSQLISG